MCVAHFRVGERKELRRKNSLISQVFVFFGRLRRQKWRRIALVLDLPKQSGQTIKRTFLSFSPMVDADVAQGSLVYGLD